MKEQREIINYEYRFIGTPQYANDIDETWEIVTVFHSWQEHNHNFIAVFRRRLNK
jgi:hypothetical protein